MAIKKNEESQRTTKKESKTSERTSFFTLFKLPTDVMNAVLSPEDRARLNEVETDPARPKKKR
jgi:hypothetical protein